MSDPDRLLASVTVPGRIESVRPAASLLVSMARHLRVPAAEQTLFEVALVEALSNAIRHNARDEEAPLRCDFELAGRTLTIRVLDEGIHAPVSLTVPTGAAPWSDATAEAWEAIPETGYGLYLMRAVFPEIKPVTHDGRHGIELQLTF
jgi:anti-sigma regulatory factor (Ser/Thr protein kinase)